MQCILGQAKLLAGLRPKAEIDRLVAQQIVVRKEDPSQFFEKPEKKIGSGGFADVFKIKRKSD